MFRVNEISGCDLMSCRGSKGGAMECGVVQWARTLGLRRKFAGSGETKFPSFVSILMAEVVWDFQHFNGLANDMNMTSVDVC